MQNIEVYLDQKNKEYMQRIKDQFGTNLNQQLKSIFFNYYLKSVEELADLFLNFYKKDNDILTETITIKEHIIDREIEYFRKIHKALLTKIPRLEFREFLAFIIYDHFNKER